MRVSRKSLSKDSYGLRSGLSGRKIQEMRLVSEIKRRNVLRMAALYLVAAWLIMQVAGELIDLAHLPDWIGPTVLALLTIGFPIALVLSWFYELTPDGIALEKDIGPGEGTVRARGRRFDFVVISLLSAAVLLFAYDKWGPGGQTVQSIAVLPFVSLGADVDLGYLADVMTVELGNELGRIDTLSIRSRKSMDSYRETDKLLPQIARELQVDALVDGSIQQFEGELRITLQLVDGRTDQQLWTEAFHSDVADFLSLQGEVARAIANQIEVRLSPETEARFARDRRTTPEALKLLAVGHHLLNQLNPGSFQQALRAFNEAIKRDPEFAEAYAGIAQAHLLAGSWHGSKDVKTMLPLARSAANKAVYLDPDLGAGHFLLGQISRMEWQWEAAELAYAKGRELNLSDSVFYLEYANLLTAMGRTEEAIEIARKGVEMDPLSPNSYNELGFALLTDGQINAALQQYQIALSLDPEFWQTNWAIADLYNRTSQFDKALPHIEKLQESIGVESWTMYGLLGLQYGQVGRHDETRRILSLLMAKRESEYVPAIALAYLYLGLENNDEALKWLYAAYEERDLSLVWLREMWIYDALRTDARFQDLVAKMDFPD